MKHDRFMVQALLNCLVGVKSLLDVLLAFGRAENQGWSFDEGEGDRDRRFRRRCSLNAWCGASGFSRFGVISTDRDLTST